MFLTSYLENFMGCNKSKPFSSNPEKNQGVLNDNFIDKPQQFIIGDRIIQEDCYISEGGYGYIWKCHDIQTKQYYALKRMLCKTQEQLTLAKHELEVMKQLPEHDNLIKLIDGDIIPVQQNVYIAVFLMELCEFSLQKIIELQIEESQVNPKKQTSQFEEKFILQVIKDICEGLKTLHYELEKPITHRDIKVDNILFREGKYKIVDFGSTSSEIVDLSKMDKKEKAIQEELYEKYTTLMYRPPEMCDLLLGYNVNQKVDIWMLGCVLYTMMFLEHPFETQEKLAIVTAGFQLNETVRYSRNLNLLLIQMLTPNPNYRIDTKQILEYITQWDDENFQIKLNEQQHELAKRFQNLDIKDIQIEINCNLIQDNLQCQQNEINLQKQQSDDWGEFQEVQTKQN